MKKNILRGTYKVILLFSKTFFYYLKSLLHKERVLEFKQKWAQNSLAEFGYEFIEIGPRPNSDQGLILVGNHISFLDIMVLMSVSPKITFVAKKEVRRWPIIGVSAARVGTIFVDRNPSADRKKVRAEMAEQIQKKAAYVTVFPSGTTSLVENKTWKKGIFEVAKEYAVPVQAFKLQYEPLRESAFIDDDGLLSQMYALFGIKNKKVILTWLGEFPVDDPLVSAEKIRSYIENY